MCARFARIFDGPRVTSGAPLVPTVLFLALLGAGCSNSPYPEGEPSRSVLFRTFRDVVSFDPSVSYNTDDGEIMDQVYPTFYRYHFLKRPYVAELDLGAGEPEIKKLTGGREDWTFHLRHDIRFQDDPCFPGGKGRQVVANDIVFAFKRFCDPRMLCPVADFVADKIVGWKSYADQFNSKGDKHFDDELPGVQEDVHDPFSFTVHLTQHYPQLRYIMAMHFTTPIAREAVATYKTAFSTFHWVGCGAYKLLEYIPGQRIILVRNSNMTFERYPSEKSPEDPASMLRDAGKPLPITDKIVYTHVREHLTSYNLFQQGYLDVQGATYSNIQVMPGAASLTAAMEARGVQLHREEAVSVDWLAFNMRDATFGGYTEQRRKLRQAISLAIDSNAYIDIVDQKMGRPAQFIVAPSLDGYDPSYKNPYRQYDPSLTRAKQLLAEAGYPNGIDPKTGNRLTLHFDNFADTPALRQMARLFIAEIEELGLRVESRESDYGTFTAHVKSGEYQFLFSNWFADYPDAENFMQLLYGPNSSPGPNDAMYANPKYDRLFGQMRSMDNGPERERIICRMRDIAVEDCPRIYLSHLEWRDLVQPWVRNDKVVTVGNEFDLYFGVDPSLRTKLQRDWNGHRSWPFFAAIALGLIGIAPAGAAIAKRRNRKIRRNAPN